MRAVKCAQWAKMTGDESYLTLYKWFQLGWGYNSLPRYCGVTSEVEFVCFVKRVIHQAFQRAEFKCVFKVVVDDVLCEISVNIEGASILKIYYVVMENVIICTNCGTVMPNESGCVICPTCGTHSCGGE